MPKIVNESYREFLDKGTIHVMEPQEFHKKLDDIKFDMNNFKTQEWKNFLILLYYSGRGPAELLPPQGKDITQKGQFVSIMIQTRKKGRTTLFYFNSKRVPDIKNVYKWAKNNHPDLLLFRSLISSTQDHIKWKTKKGEHREKTYTRTSKNITYYVKKFFGVPPYFFRHNRFSSMSMSGADIKHIKHAKGAADYRSVERYIHLSEKEAKETSKYIKK